jgi:hypothetical protein
MKKKIVVTTALSAVIASSFAFGVYAASDIKLMINGKKVDAPVEIIDGSSYVPLRVVSEALGAEVKWDGDSRTITIGGTGTVTAPKPDVKSFDVNVLVESGPMKMKITKVTFDPAFQKDKYSKSIKAILLDVNIENTIDDKIRWNPDGFGSKLVLNTKEQIENPAPLQSDDVGGEFLGKVIKSGKIAFEVKGDITAITSMNYTIRGAIKADSPYSSVGPDRTAEIILK